MKFFYLCLLFSTALPRTHAQPASFAYVLQADALTKNKAEAVAKLAACGRDWIIIDANFSNGQPWTTADISAIRAGRAGRKVIAYLSIGEAGNYRAYWQPAWDADNDGKPDAGAPAFLLAQNPDWKTDYRVKYWQADWQKLILAEADKIMAAGFDGLYLDIVDGFETFERDGNKFIDDRINPETRQTYRRDMVTWVKAVAARAHQRNAAAIIIPQNGTQLLAQPDFLATADAVGVEDLFTNGEKKADPEHAQYILQCLGPALARHLPILDIEYARSKTAQAESQTEADRRGLIRLFTDRELKTLGESGK